MGHESNEQETIIAPPISKLKGCTHTNKAEKNPNEKLQKDPKLKAKPKLKDQIILGSTRDHLKEWLTKNQKWPNHFPRPYLF